MSKEISASCSCGNVQFKSKAVPLLELTCHCEDCQKFTGSDLVTLAYFNCLESTVSGELTKQNSKAFSGNTVTRESCAKCGSSMFESTSGFPGFLGVMAGVINKPFIAQPQNHIWVKNKKPYVSIPENVQQFEQSMA
jgi:hypothetical protein